MGGFQNTSGGSPRQDKTGGQLDRGNDRIRKAFSAVSSAISSCAVACWRGRMIKNHRPILRSNVVSLAVRERGSWMRDRHRRRKSTNYAAGRKETADRVILRDLDWRSARRQHFPSVCGFGFGAAHNIPTPPK